MLIHLDTHANTKMSVVPHNTLIEAATVDSHTGRINILSKRWRMNHLYTILPKDRPLEVMKLNHAQLRVLYNYRHNKKIILKSRQQGISTLYVAYNLDACIFTPNYQAGIQSYGRDESAKLYKRALIMWDNFPQEIKEELGLTLKSSSTISGLEFSNGSSLKIGNFRGDTLHSLHISELAKISKKYPEKANELKTGAFQAVSSQNIITIETTAEGDIGLFPEIWFQSMSLIDAGIELTPLDFQPIFLSWMEDIDCTLSLPSPIEVIPQLMDYFKELEDEFSLAIDTSTVTYHSTNMSKPLLSFTQEQINWLVPKLRELGSDFNREYPASARMAFAQSIEGTYFQKQYEVLKQEDRIQEIEYHSQYPVYTSWDIGVNDEGVVLLWQIYDGYIYLIDEYHATGEGVEHYLEILTQLGVAGDIKRHIFPHDIAVKEWGSGRTRVETLNSLGVYNIDVLGKLTFADSISAARSLLIGNLIVAKKCRQTIAAIQNYRKKKDEKLGVYLPTDVHDIHSNYMAAFRYGAQGLSTHLVKGSRPKTHKKEHKMVRNSPSVAV